MIALGRLASISLTGVVALTYRRAMSWAHCAPKSTTRTVSY
jgi:hypothetical protein